MTRNIRRRALILTTTIVAVAAGAACFEGLTAPLPASRAVAVDSGAIGVWTDVSGSRVAWTAATIEGYAIDVEDLATGRRWAFPPTAGATQVDAPSVDGDRAVWMEFVPDSAWLFESRIVLADLRGGSPVAITNAEYEDQWPDISGDRVAWQRSDPASGTSRILVYDIPTGRTTVVPAGRVGESVDLQPSISGDRVVFERLTYVSGAAHPLAEVMLYDLSTGNLETLNPRAGSSQGGADIAGDIVAWLDVTDGAGHLVYEDLATGRVVRVTGERARPNWPRVSGSRIVWEDKRYGEQSDIYVYDLGTGKETRVTYDFSDQRRPVVSDGWLAWRDEGPPTRLMALKLPVGPTP